MLAESQQLCCRWRSRTCGTPRDDDGERAALRVLVTAREHMTTERTSTINALTALLRTIDLGVDARRPLTSTQVAEITGGVPGPKQSLLIRLARSHPPRQTSDRTPVISRREQVTNGSARACHSSGDAA